MTTLYAERRQRCAEQGHDVRPWSIPRLNFDRLLCPSCGMSWPVSMANLLDAERWTTTEEESA